VRSLRFDDRPDYDYLKRLFRELFFRKGFSYDNMFDWELLAMQNQRGGRSAEDGPVMDEDAGAGGGGVDHKASDEGGSQGRVGTPGDGLVASGPDDRAFTRGTEGAAGGDAPAHGYQTRGAAKW